MNIYEKLMAIQDELKAPKNLDNNYGNYKYRSAEKIFEAAASVTILDFAFSERSQIINGITDTL